MAVVAGTLLLPPGRRCSRRDVPRSRVSQGLPPHLSSHRPLGRSGRPATGSARPGRELAGPFFRLCFKKSGAVGAICQSTGTPRDCTAPRAAPNPRPLERRCGHTGPEAAAPKARFVCEPPFPTHLAAWGVNRTAAPRGRDLHRGGASPRYAWTRGQPHPPRRRLAQRVRRGLPRRWPIRHLPLRRHPHQHRVVRHLPLP